MCTSFCFPSATVNADERWRGLQDDVEDSLPYNLVKLSLLSVSLIGDPYVEVYVNDTYIDQGAQLTSLASDLAFQAAIQVSLPTP